MNTRSAARLAVLGRLHVHVDVVSERDRTVPAGTLFAVTGTAVQFAIAVTVFASKASAFAASVGDPAAVAQIAFVAIAVVALGLALTRLFELCRVNDLPVVEILPVVAI